MHPPTDQSQEPDIENESDQIDPMPSSARTLLPAGNYAPWGMVEPMASRWNFPPPDSADEHGVIGLGGDLEPGTLLAAYRNGLFPMPYGRRRIAWFSPDPRGVLPLDGLRVTRSMRRSARRYTTTRDTAFTEVMTRCGDDRRDGRWINDAFIRAYTRLHDLGWASSVESRDDDGRPRRRPLRRAHRRSLRR